MIISPVSIDERHRMTPYTRLVIGDNRTSRRCVRGAYRDLRSEGVARHHVRSAVVRLVLAGTYATIEVTK